MKFSVSGKKGDVELDLSESSTLLDLMTAYGKIVKKDKYRCCFKPTAKGTEKPSIFTGMKKTLSELGIKNNTVLTFKDIGPQIGYSTVFYLEYFGPMVFVGLWALRPSFIYGSGATNQPYHWVSQLGIVCWMAHFMKRELETMFVHKFSRPTMPFKNLFINCTYYWTFGAIIGYPLCSPAYNDSVVPDEQVVYIGLAIFIICEIGNLICHIMLANLRPATGSDVRPIPSGFLFELVSCPNYTFEVSSWIGFSIMTGLYWSWLFTLAGFYQMAVWALKKHSLYKKDPNTGETYKKLGRKAIVPFVL